MSAADRMYPLGLTVSGSVLAEAVWVKGPGECFRQSLGRLLCAAPACGPRAVQDRAGVLSWRGGICSAWPEEFGNAWRRFWLSRLGEGWGCHWHLVVRGQGCCCTRHSPHTKKLSRSAQKQLLVPRLRIPGLVLGGALRPARVRAVGPRAS